MRNHLGLKFSLALYALAAAMPALALTDAERSAAVAAAITASGKEPVETVRQAEIVIADLDAMANSGVKRCGTEPLGAGVTGTRVQISYDYCDALFMKGFALIDLNRSSEAEPFLRRATELAPTNAHYLNEYAEWYKAARQWQRSYALFRKANDLAPLQPAEERDRRQARSLRGMGYNLIELGDLDGAELLMNQSLKLDPESQAAKTELQYIAEQRAKAAKH